MEARRSWWVISVLIVTVECREPFDAALKTGDINRLVVDGYIDAGQRSVTFVKLSRTTHAEDVTRFEPETGATLTIEGSEEGTHLLLETSPGHYQSDSLSLPVTQNYRLKIISGSTTYYSEFGKPIITPPIDSITWTQDNAGVQIFVATHATTGEQTYFKWSHEEVWERSVPYYSLCKFENDRFVARSNQETREMKTCWVYANGTDLNIESSEKYTAGVIPPTPVKSIDKFDERLYIRYSILVRQHALSEENFRFYQLLNRNDGMGTFSDPLPVELPTNVHAEGSSGQAVGWVGVYTTQQQRIEIHESELDEDWIVPPFCEENQVSASSFELISLSHTPTRPIFELPSTVAEKAWAVQTECVDCRPNGGTNRKPDFWN